MRNGVAPFRESGVNKIQCSSVPNQQPALPLEVDSYYRAAPNEAAAEKRPDEIEQWPWGFLLCRGLVLM